MFQFSGVSIIPHLGTSLELVTKKGRMGTVDKHIYYCFYGNERTRQEKQV
jgi:hypothetical protein